MKLRESFTCIWNGIHTPGFLGQKSFKTFSGVSQPEEGNHPCLSKRQNENVENAVILISFKIPEKVKTLCGRTHTYGMDSFIFL